jgi:hypothetical protein
VCDCEQRQDRLECVHQRREERLAEVQRRHLASDRAQKEAKERRDAMSQEVIYIHSHYQHLPHDLRAEQHCTCSDCVVTTCSSSAALLHTAQQ